MLGIGRGAPRKTRRRKNSLLVKILFRTVLVLGVFSVVGGAVAVFILSYSLPSVEQLGSREVTQSTRIYDRTGKILLYEVGGGKQRIVVPFQEIPQTLKDATIATEDERFYEEPAFDWRAIIRAVLVNLRLREGYVGQGASTITQQLARNAFLAPEKTFAGKLKRKFKELLIAVRLNRQYTKDQILELYLNEVPYGPTIYGVEAASQAYFGKSVKELSLSESALLAALPRAPSYYAGHPRELAERSRYVLRRMRDLGKISDQELAHALASPAAIAPRRAGLKAPHFVMAVQEYLVRKYGERVVERGGLRVISTLDWDLEQAAERAVEVGAKRNEDLYGGTNAALIAEDPKTGEVLALVGSRDYFDTAREGNFNVATQGLRQPGSALKPFVYLTAFEKGYTPETILFDVPTNFDTTGEPSRAYEPENFDGVFRGPVSLRTALAQSINVPAVKTLYLAGIDAVIENARRFGLTTLQDPRHYGLSLVLGGGAVRLADLVHAYATLAAEGVRRSQTFVLEVRDSSGRILERYQPREERVADPYYPRLVTSILSDEKAREGLFRNSLGLTVFPGYDVALKTGTSDDYRDAWALGYTPNIVIGVWAGNNDNSPMKKKGSSILAAVPIWHDVMKEALRRRPKERFTPPEVRPPSKPILEGVYPAGQGIHSILYFVRRDDPFGSPPDDPSRDPQFPNWERGVLAWFAERPEELRRFEAARSAEGGALADLPLVAISEPRAGETIGARVRVAAKIAGSEKIKGVSLYFNGAEIGRVSELHETRREAIWEFESQGTAPQNLIEVEVVDARGRKNRASVIVYK